MKKIILISQLFYPANTPRANRTFELAKELSKREGYQVIVYTLKGNYDYKEIESKYNFKVCNLGKIMLSNISPTYQGYDFFMTRLMKKIFGKLIHFPEIELSYRVFKLLKKENNIHGLISIAVPYPIHWGVALFKQFNKNNLIRKWIADCGDPFMGNPIVKHPFYFSIIEKWFFRKTDFITIPIEKARTAYYQEFNDKIRIVPQGFEFKTIRNNYVENEIPTFIYSGIFYENIRDPRKLLDFLTTIDSPFLFKVYTKTPQLLHKYKEKLGDKLFISSYIDRDDLINELSQSDFLINFENNSEVQSPSKLIDYGLSKRPILNITSVINKDIVYQFLSGNYSNKYNINIDEFNIKVVVDKFLYLINEEK